MATCLKTITHHVFLFSFITLSGVAASQARVARHVPQPTASMTEPARLGGSSPSRLDDQRADPMCEVSRMQVPSAAGGLAWEQVEDCDQD